MTEPRDGQQWYGPTPHILEGFAHANLGWKRALGEWIDNALDARAQTISIEFVKDGLRIQDDGVGCRNPGDMIQFGQHTRHGTTMLGRYGVGGKDAALWVGMVESTLEIETVYGGVVRSLCVNWKRLRDKEWYGDAPSERPASPFDSGTTITITSKKRRKQPYGEEWETLLEELGYLFSPAIKRGCQIKIKKQNNSEWKVLERWSLPQFDDHGMLARTIEIDGRKAKLHCGVVPPGGSNPKAGFTYWRAHRVIEAASAKGCGRYSPAHVCGIVELDDSWPLTRHKDAISGGADKLYASVEEAAREVLERGDKIGSVLQSSQFMSAANAQLNALIQQHSAKARRRKGEKKGTITPVGDKGTQHNRAKLEQPGRKFQGRTPGSCRIDYIGYGKATPIGEVKGEGVILLNQDNPAVHGAKTTQNVAAIVFLAVCLIGADQCYAPGGKGQFAMRGIATGTPSDFADWVGTILAVSDVSFDGKPMLRAV